MSGPAPALTARPAGSLAALLDPKVLGAPLAGSVAEDALRDLRQIRFGGPALKAAPLFSLPVRTHEQAFTMVEWWDQITGSRPFESAETAAALVSRVAEDVALLAEELNGAAREAAAFYAADLAGADPIGDGRLAALREKLADRAMRLRVTGVLGHIDEATQDTLQALARVRGMTRSAAEAAELAREARAKLETGPSLIKITDSWGVVLKPLARGLGALDTVVAVVPIAAAALDLLAAKTPEQSRAALRAMAKGTVDMGVEGAAGLMTAGVAAVAVTLAPVGLGIYTTIGVSLVVGRLGLFREEQAKALLTEKLKLTPEPKK